MKGAKMKKYFASILITIMIICTVACGYEKSEGNRMNNSENNQMFSQYKVPNSHLPKDGVVPDKKTAISVADTILSSIYGESIKETEPFNVEFDDKYQVWVINGVLKANKVGGVPNIIIQKRDGKIIAVWHTK